MEVLALLATPVTKVVKCLIAPLGRQIGYIFRYKNNARNLKEKVEELLRMRNDVEVLMEAARRRGDLIKQVVEAWLAQVDTARDEAMRLNDGVEEINSWFKGGCYSCYHLAKEAEKKIGIVNGLLDKGQSFNSVSEPAPPPSIEFVLTSDFHAFASRESAMKQVIDAFQDEKNNIVGVYGMGGVGKTTLMKEVGKKLKREELFDEVVMATVSQNPDKKKIQAELAEKLGMELNDESEDLRARRLSKRLKEEKRILVILDDLWKRLDLAEVGIPYSDDCKSCKVILTTRSQDVCNHMEAQANIELKVLSEHDSWNLFQQKAGDVVESPAFQTLAMEVVRECKGLPLAIVTLGRALRGKDQIYTWVDAARQLKKSIYKGMSPVFSSIKLSYDYLESEETKKCFLFCCFFPEDYVFTHNDLMPYIMGEGIFRNIDTLEEIKDRLHTVMDELIASCLLLKADEDKDVYGYKMRMHDVVRDTVLSIASEESNGFISKAGLGLTQWPKKEDLRTCIRMSLIGNEIRELPEQPECPQLLTLSLSKNYRHERFSYNFFQRMASLVTLDVQYTWISSLPPSLPCLVNLRVLQLDHTLLCDASLVGKLKKLEILGLSWTRIQRLPEEIRELTNLRMLDLSYNKKLEIIPPDVFSNLSLLEELYMDESFCAWEIDEMGDGSKARLVELASLSHLSTLSLRVDNVNCLSKDNLMLPENLKDFSIRISGRSAWESKLQRNMSLTITSDPISNWVKVLLERTYELHLFSCKGLKNFAKHHVGRLNNLKSLYIEDCPEIEYLMSVVDESSKTSFSGLEKLKLKSMEEFGEIYHGPLPNGFLEKLKFLCVDECHKTISLISFDLLSRLQNLEKLYVRDCDVLKEVFQSEGLEEEHVIRQVNCCDISTSFPSPPIFPNLRYLEIGICGNLNYIFPMALVRQGLVQLQQLKLYCCDKMEFIVDDDGQKVDEKEDKKMLPRLRILKLEHLPNLSSFCKQWLHFGWPSLEELTVIRCPNLKRLPIGQESAPRLRRISGDTVAWFHGLEWEDRRIKLRLKPLFQKNPKKAYLRPLREQPRDLQTQPNLAHELKNH